MTVINEENPKNRPGGVEPDLPSFSRSRTYEVKAPECDVFVTIVHPTHEVIVSAGKAGSAATTLADCMGKLITLALNYDKPSLAVVAAVLDGAGHDRTDLDRYDSKSIPDAIAKAIQEFLSE
jgi:hypothetical protein